ncbi:hypothetical protein M758_UG243000 [Ceratodon purpureus]|nr:hypothetical protein M758_UG243000 [Ceratodon purpureus]
MQRRSAARHSSALTAAKGTPELSHHRSPRHYKRSRQELSAANFFCKSFQPHHTLRHRWSTRPLRSPQPHRCPRYCQSFRRCRCSQHPRNPLHRRSSRRHQNPRHCRSCRHLQDS